ncbi:YiiG family protein [Microvirga sp. M2]|uniref:YiiG family protein n=1 Tax=Microvirga sp. M2 TaxID=3073270 RepID=UPI0039C2B789
MIRTLLLAVVLLGTAPMAAAQAPDATRPQQAEDAALEAINAKMNAYVALMNRTLRASESIERYKSWVDMEKGPVNKNRVFGVYDLYDVTDLIAEASAALGQEPKLPELDGSMKTYIEAYSGLAPIIDEANTYYERKDYLDDNLARGKQIHARLAPAARAFLAARETVNQTLQLEHMNLNRQELALIERREGRKARWHRANLMMAAQRIVDRLPDSDDPTVDVAALDADVTALVNASAGFEDYRKSDPEALKSLQGGLRSFVAAAREFRDTIKPLKGDLRRGGGQQAQALVNAYNGLVGSANSAAD